MSIISARFNRFYHRAVLVELFNRCGTLRFPLWMDDETGGVFEFVKGEHFSDMDELKQLLKNMNVDYAVDGDKKISTTDIESGPLVQHIEYVFSVAADSGVSLPVVEEEWLRLLSQAGIRK